MGMGQKWPTHVSKLHLLSFITFYYHITIFGAINITKDPWSSCLGYHRRFQVWLEVGLRIWKAADHAGLPRARPAKHDLPLLDDCRGLYFYYPRYWWFMANGPWWKTHENQATMEWQRILYCLNKNYSISKSHASLFWSCFSDCFAFAFHPELGRFGPPGQILGGWLKPLNPKIQSSVWRWCGDACLAGVRRCGFLTTRRRALRLRGGLVWPEGGRAVICWIVLEVYGWFQETEVTLQMEKPYFRNDDSPIHNIYYIRLYKTQVLCVYIDIASMCSSLLHRGSQSWESLGFRRSGMWSGPRTKHGAAVKMEIEWLYQHEIVTIVIYIILLWLLWWWFL